MSKTIETSKPHLGVFWLVGNRPVVFSSPAIEVIEECGFKDYEGSHIELWPEVQKKYQALAGGSYESLPRGRVTYSVEDDAYKILLPKLQSTNQRLVHSLLARFGLEHVNVTVLADQHYDPPAQAFDVDE